MAKDEEAGKSVGFDQVRPILRKRCQNCHNPEELRGDLSLTDVGAINAGSSSGPVVVPGKPRESLLYTTAAHLDEPTMPPNSRKIPGRELDILKRWIEDGLVLKSGDSPTQAGLAEQHVRADETKSSSPEQEPEIDSHFEPVRPLLQNASISSISTEPNGTHVALPGDQQIVLWDAATQQFDRAIAFPEGEISQLTYSRDGKVLVVAGGLPGLNATVSGVDPITGETRFRVADENDSILGLDLSPNGELVAFGGPSKLLKICRVNDGKVLHTLRKHTDWVLATEFSPDGLLVASADRFGGLFVWEAETGELFQALKGHSGPVNSLAWDADGETLLSGGEDGQVRVWNLHHGDLTAQWDAGVEAILSLDRREGFTVVAGRNGLVKAWRTPDQCLGTYEAPEQMEAVAILHDANQVISTDSQGNIHLLELPKLTPINATSLPFSESARSELLSRLEQQSRDFNELMREEQAQRLLAQQQPEPVDRPSAVNSELADLLQRELEEVQTSLDKQIAMKREMERHLGMLETQLQTQAMLVESSQRHLERLGELQRLVEGSLLAGKLTAEEKSRILIDQLRDQIALREAIEPLQKQALESARTALRLPADSRPSWDATIDLLEQLIATIHSQSLSTETVLESMDSISSTGE